VQEYSLRENLSKIGYVFDGSKLSAFKADCFNLIAMELSKIEQEEIKKARRGK
jgi:hypothetical protein